MVHVEIARHVLPQIEHAHTGGGQRPHVRPAASRVAARLINAQRCQHARDLAKERQAGFGHLRIEREDAVGPGIAFAGQHDAFILVLGGIGAAADQPEFLRTPQYHTDSAARPLPALVHVRLDGGSRGEADGDAGAIVEHALAQIPAVQMPAEHHHFLRNRAGNFGGDVGGLAGLAAWRGHQLHLHRASGTAPRQQFGIGQSQCQRRDRGGARREHGAAGVRIAVIICAQAADQHGGSALLRAQGRRSAAHGAVHAIAAAILRDAHAVIDENDAAFHSGVGCGAERGEIAETGDGRGDAARWRGPRGAERGERQLVIAAHDGRAGLPTFPYGERKRLLADIHQPQLLHFGLRPRAPARFGFRPRKALAHCIGKARQQPPRFVAGQGGIAQLGGGGQTVSAGRLCADWKGYEAGRGGQGSKTAHVRVPLFVGCPLRAGDAGSIDPFAPTAPIG